MSQCDAIIRHMAKGYCVTPLTALHLCGSLRLSARIKELRRKGWPIVTHMVSINSKRVASYSIPAAQMTRVRKRIG